MIYQVGMPTCKIPNISRAHTEIAQCCPSHSAIKMTQPSVNTRLQNKEHQEGKHTALIANHENGNENCPFSVVKGDIVRCETRSVLVGRFGLIRVIKKDGQAWTEFQYWWCTDFIGWRFNFKKISLSVGGSFCHWLSSWFADCLGKCEN